MLSPVPNCEGPGAPAVCFGNIIGTGTTRRRWGEGLTRVDALHLEECRRAAQLRAGKIELFWRYMTATVAPAGAMPTSFTAGCGRSDRNQPAESHARGITNSDQPQSRQTRMSGDGVIGG